MIPRALALLSADSRYPHLHELTSGYFGQEWFYINSFLLNSESYTCKHQSEATQDEIQSLPYLVVDEICKNHTHDKSLIQNSIEDINRLLSSELATVDDYKNELAYELVIFDMPFESMEEYKKFLLKFREKLMETLDS